LAVRGEMGAGRVLFTGLLLAVFLLALRPSARAGDYPWRAQAGEERSIASEIVVPVGFARTEVEAESFGAWLRHLPVKAKGAPVLLHDGRRKPDQGVHAAVLDIDTGKRDLQQCADAVIRLRAEYLFSRKRLDAIRFRATSGDEMPFEKWGAGYRPVVRGDRLTWARQTQEDWSHASLRGYLDSVFTYAGSYSLAGELKPRRDAEDLRIGDVFIRAGFPGHAVIVVDAAGDIETHEKIFLLAQSYMPAQDMHVLKNPSDGSLSPWYRIPSGPTLDTPEWTFKKNELKYFE
jgi:hypothetical protein